MKKLAFEVRKVQMLYNRVVSEASTIHELPSDRSETKVEIKAMA